MVGNYPPGELSGYGNSLYSDNFPPGQFPTVEVFVLMSAWFYWLVVVLSYPTDGSPDWDLS